jgi:hypothetical protein
MEGAGRLPLAAALFQLHATADHLDDVGAGEQFVDEALWDPAGHSVCVVLFRGSIA